MNPSSCELIAAVSAVHPSERSTERTSGRTKPRYAPTGAWWDVKPEVYGHWARGPLRQRIPGARRSCAAVG
jgi:hypothetical protein